MRVLVNLLPSSDENFWVTTITQCAGTQRNKKKKALIILRMCPGRNCPGNNDATDGTTTLLNLFFGRRNL